MDWEFAIARQRTALLRIVARLFVMARRGALVCGVAPENAVAAGLTPSSPGLARTSPGLAPTSPLWGSEGRQATRGTSQTAEASGGGALPRHLHRAILRILRPAEAAARRLVIALAHTLPTPEPKVRATQAPEPNGTFIKSGAGTGIVLPKQSSKPRKPPERLTLPLFDTIPTPFRPIRVAQSSVPRISAPGFTRPFPVAPRRAPGSNDTLDATRLRLRLEAVFEALDDLHAAAGRYARRQANSVAQNQAFRDAAAQGEKSPARQRQSRRTWPLRPGRPPGFHRKAWHEVHQALNISHWLAFSALERRDTS